MASSREPPDPWRPRAAPAEPSGRPVIADTNGLMAPFQFHFNLDDELGRLLGSYRLIVPRRVLWELAALAKSTPAALSALRLAQRYEVVEVTDKGDGALVKAAMLQKAAVLTNDKELRRACFAVGIPTITLRKRRHLVLEQ